VLNGKAAGGDQPKVQTGRSENEERSALSKLARKRGTGGGGGGDWFGRASSSWRWRAVSLIWTAGGVEGGRGQESVSDLSEWAQ
jgi:hypothetical protein